MNGRYPDNQRKSGRWSPADKGKMTVYRKFTVSQTISVIFFSLLAGMILLSVSFSSRSAASSMPSTSLEKLDSAVSMAAFDYERAAEISAMRWQAMAHFYEAQDQLTRDNFDYEEAADLMAYRWQAMAQAYQRMGSLNDQTSNAQPGPDWFRALLKGNVIDEIPTP